MRVATFNVLHGQLIGDGQPRPLPAGATAGEPLAQAVASLDADVLALQELDHLQARSGGTDQAAVAATALGAADWRYASACHGRWVPGKGWVRDGAEPELRTHGPGDPPGPPSHGIALLSRLPVRDWRVRRLPPAPTPMPLLVAGRTGLALVQDQPRAALAAVLEGPDGPFTVIAVHLSFVPGWNAGQLAVVRRWVADLPRPQLLLGDLNLPGPVPGAVLGAAAAVDGPGLQPQARSGARDRWRSLARAATYPSQRPVVQFDYLLAAGMGREAVRAASAPLMPISDHRPLVIELAS